MVSQDNTNNSLADEIKALKELVSKLLLSQTAAANDQAPATDICTQRDKRMLAIFTESGWNKLRLTGQSPPFYRRNGRIYYRWSEVESWVLENRVEGQA